MDVSAQPCNRRTRVFRDRSGPHVRPIVEDAPRQVAALRGETGGMREAGPDGCAAVGQIIDDAKELGSLVII
jgi:hypothetical protein